MDGRREGADRGRERRGAADGSGDGESFEISGSLLTRWHREACEGLLIGNGDRTPFTPVALRPGAAAKPAAFDVQDRLDDMSHDRVEIILPNGRRLLIAASTETSVLARLIQVVERA